MNFILLLSFAAFSLFQGCYAMEDNNKKRKNENQEADHQSSKKQKHTIQEQQLMNDSLGRALLVTDLKLAIELIEKGADINFQSNTDGNKTPLMKACGSAWYQNSSKLVELLLSKGADINAKDRRGMTALHYAVCQGRPAHVELLLASGALMTRETEFGETPLHCACLFAPKENVELIIKHIKELAHVKSKEKLVFLCSLSEKFRKEVKRIFLINKRLDPKIKMPKPLCDKIAHMMYNPDEILCELVNMKDKLGKTPLDRVREAASIGMMGPEREQEFIALLTPYENIKEPANTGCIIL